MACLNGTKRALLNLTKIFLKAIIARDIVKNSQQTVPGHYRKPETSSVRLTKGLNSLFTEIVRYKNL